VPGLDSDIEDEGTK